MRRFLVGFIAALGLGFGGAQAQCSGTDLIPSLREQDPAALAEIERAAAAMPFAKGKLFRIEADGVEPSYLFGTMHVGDPRVTTLRPAARAAFEGADVAAFELEDIGGLADPRSLQGLGVKVLRYLLPKADERIESMLPEEDIRRLEAALTERGQPRSAARSMKPGIVAMTILGQLCRRYGIEDVLDARLTQAARDQGKDVVGLETIEEQLAAIGLLPANEQKRLVTGALRILDRAGDLYETMVARYATGDIGFILALSQHPRAVPGVEIEVPRLLHEQLLDVRNLRMLDRALPLVEEGGVFIAVGAAHLPGEKGFARLIEQAGYRVTRVEGADEPAEGR